MATIPSIEDALRAAIKTALEQPGQVPEAPAGWLQRAQGALDTQDHQAITDAAVEICRAHSQYRADFDVKGWLYDLRNARLANIEIKPEPSFRDERWARNIAFVVGQRLGDEFDEEQARQALDVLNGTRRDD